MKGIAVERQLAYKAGDQVEVYDTARQRWYKARALWRLQYATEDTLEAWDCEWRSGTRGSFDSAHMRTPEAPHTKESAWRP